MSEFDEGVILRAHRFRAEMVGYRLERGHYMDKEDDRADRWYVVPASQHVSTAADRSGPGFPHERRGGGRGRAARPAEGGGRRLGARIRARVDARDE